jgi:hypothetical protein
MLPSLERFILAPASAFDKMIFIHRGSFVLTQLLLLSHGKARDLSAFLSMVDSSTSSRLAANRRLWTANINNIVTTDRSGSSQNAALMQATTARKSHRC